MAKSISEDDYLKIVGLLALAASHKEKLEDIILALEGATGEEEHSNGHCDDAAYCGYTANDLLQRLGFEKSAKKKKNPINIT